MDLKEIEDTRCGRRQYLVTYSQADLNKFPTRESFGNAIEKAFNSGNGNTKVLHWACCQESHEKGGVHYHCCLKLSSVKKWLGVKKLIDKNHKITVNFSDSHTITYTHTAMYAKMTPAYFTVKTTPI